MLDLQVKNKRQLQQNIELQRYVLIKRLKKKHPNWMLLLIKLITFLGDIRWLLLVNWLLLRYAVAKLALNYHLQPVFARWNQMVQ